MIYDQCLNRQSVYDRRIVERMTTMEPEKLDPVKPEYEMFFGVKYKAYCGNCERLLFTGGRYYTVKDAEERVKVCPHCRRRVDWSE